MNAFGLTSLIWVDYSILGLVGLSALYGLTRGLVREVLSLALWLGAGWVALRYNHAFAAHLEQAIPLESARLSVAFGVIYLGVLLLGGMVISMFGKLMSSAGLGGADRLAGLVFGLARGALVVAILVMLAGVTSLPREPWWKQSKLIPSFQALALWVRERIPEGLAAQVKFPEAIVKR